MRIRGTAGLVALAIVAMALIGGCDLREGDRGEYGGTSGDYGLKAEIVTEHTPAE